MPSITVIANKFWSTNYCSKNKPNIFSIKYNSFSTNTTTVTLSMAMHWVTALKFFCLSIFSINLKLPLPCLHLTVLYNTLVLIMKLHLCILSTWPWFLKKIISHFLHCSTSTVSWFMQVKNLVLNKKVCFYWSQIQSRLCCNNIYHSFA